MIYTLYPAALELGIAPEEFWEMSLAEILAVMEAKNREERHQYKQQISLIFSSAEAVSSRIGYLFTEEKKRRKSQIVQPWDIFPELYKEEKRESEKAEEAAAIEQQKLQMTAFMERWNARRKEAE